MSLLLLQESWAISRINIFLSLYRCWNRGSEKPRGFSKTSSTVVEWTQLLLFSWRLCRKPPAGTLLDHVLDWVGAWAESSVQNLTLVFTHCAAILDKSLDMSKPPFVFSVYKKEIIALDSSEFVKVSTQGIDQGKGRWRVVQMGKWRITCRWTMSQVSHGDCMRQHA